MRIRPAGWKATFRCSRQTSLSQSTPKVDWDAKIGKPQCLSDQTPNCQRGSKRGADGLDQQHRRCYDGCTATRGGQDERTDSCPGGGSAVSPIVERLVVAKGSGEAVAIGGCELGLEARVILTVGGMEAVGDHEPAAGPERAASLCWKRVSLEPLEGGGDCERIECLVGQGWSLGRAVRSSVRSTRSAWARTSAETAAPTMFATICRRARQHFPS